MNIRCNKTGKIITVATRAFIAAFKSKHQYIKFFFNTSYVNPYVEVEAWID